MIIGFGLFQLIFLFILWCLLRAASIADEEILKQERINKKNNRK